MSFSAVERHVVSPWNVRICLEYTVQARSKVCYDVLPHTTITTNMWNDTFFDGGLSYKFESITLLLLPHTPITPPHPYNTTPNDTCRKNQPDKPATHHTSKPAQHRRHVTPPHIDTTGRSRSDTTARRVAQRTNSHDTLLQYETRLQERRRERGVQERRFVWYINPGLSDFTIVESFSL